MCRYKLMYMYIYVVNKKQMNAHNSAKTDTGKKIYWRYTYTNTTI